MEFDEDVYHNSKRTVETGLHGTKVSQRSSTKLVYISMYVDSTVLEPDRQLEAMGKLILTIGLPDFIFRSMLYLKTAHNYYKYLTNRFNKSTVQPLQERLRKVEGCCDAEPQVVLHLTRVEANVDLKDKGFEGS